MWLLVGGLLVFFGIHLLPTAVPLRQRIAAWKGEDPYKLGFSLIAAAGLVMMGHGKAVAPRITVYEPPAWTAHVSWILMWLAVTIFPAAYLPSNLKRVMCHPLLFGVSVNPT